MKVVAFAFLSKEERGERREEREKGEKRRRSTTMMHLHEGLP